MRTIADAPLGSLMGLMVLAAMFTAIWNTRDSSAGAAAGHPARTLVEAHVQPRALRSARTDRAPVTHTSIAPAQLRELQGR
jgi:hypothetical protein